MQWSVPQCPRPAALSCWIVTRSAAGASGEGAISGAACWGDHLLCHCVIIQNMHTLRLHYWPLHYCYAYAMVEAEVPEFLSFAARTEVRRSEAASPQPVIAGPAQCGAGWPGAPRSRLPSSWWYCFGSGVRTRRRPSRRALNTAQINLHSGHCSSGV